MLWKREKNQEKEQAFVNYNLTVKMKVPKKSQKLRKFSQKVKPKENEMYYNKENWEINTDQYFSTLLFIIIT